MKYPILYKSNETDFFTMGLGPIEMLKATVTQERNGIFIFEGEILTDNPLFPLVLENYIIKADADHLLKDQRFRIKRVVPNHNGKAQIYAEHVSYLSRELTIKPEVNITGSAQVALNQWKSSIVESNPFIVSSDITTSASTKWRIDKVENPMMALGGVEGSILDRWGGEYLFDNYHISLLKKRGKTATNILAYGRNITDFEQERNIANTYTSIAPYAIYTDDKEREIVVHVDGYVVDSEHVNKYPNRVTLPVDFSNEFGHDEVPTKARLLALANQYIKANEIGVPSTSIKVSFVDLSKSADYAEYAFLEQVNLCDDVRVYYPKLGVNTVAKVIRTVWNVLTESYDETEIGQKRMSLASQMQEQQKAIKEINTQAIYAQVSADGKNMIFYGLYGVDGLGQPTATKIGDTWFKPNGLETEMLIWTGVVWTNPFLGGDNIADEAITGTKIANATIGNAKIINVDAYKITVGTLTGHTINGAYINGGTINGGTINGANITGGTFYNSGSRGDFHIYDGMVKATSYNTVADGTILSEDGYITLRAGGTGSGSHVFLQSVTEVRATRPREFSTYIPMVALEFRIPGWTYLARNVWSTYGNGIEDMFIKPSDIGSLRVMSAGNGRYRPVMASAFNQSSSREFKENIKTLQESGLDVVRGFDIVTYNLKDDPNKETQVGLIAEDNRTISSFEGDSINIYKMTSYNSKAIQELDKNQKETEIVIWQLKNEIEALKGAINE